MYIATATEPDKTWSFWRLSELLYINPERREIPLHSDTSQRKAIKFWWSRVHDQRTVYWLI